MKKIATQLMHSLYTFTGFSEFRLIFSLVHCLQGASRVFEVGMLSLYGILGQRFGKYDDFLMHARGEKKGCWKFIKYKLMALHILLIPGSKI